MPSKVMTQLTEGPVMGTTKTIVVAQDELYPVFYEVSGKPDPKYDKPIEVDVSFYARWQKAEKEFRAVTDELKELYKKA